MLCCAAQAELCALPRPNVEKTRALAENTNRGHCVVGPTSIDDSSRWIPHCFIVSLMFSCGCHGVFTELNILSKVVGSNGDFQNCFIVSKCFPTCSGVLGVRDWTTDCFGGFTVVLSSAWCSQVGSVRFCLRSHMMVHVEMLVPEKVEA